MNANELRSAGFSDVEIKDYLGNAGFTSQEIDTYLGVKPDVTAKRVAGGLWQEMKHAPAAMAASRAASIENAPETSPDEKVLLNWERRFSPMERQQQGGIINKLIESGTPKEDAWKQSVLEIQKSKSKKPEDVEKSFKAQTGLLSADADSRKKQAEAAVKFWRGIADSKALELSPEYQGQSSGWLEDLARAVGGTAPSMAGLALDPTIGIPMMYDYIKGATYENLIKEGVKPDRAEKAATASAMAQIPLEAISGLFIIKKALGGGRPWIKYLTDTIGASMGEGATEFVQQYPDEIATIWAANPDLSGEEVLSEIKKKIPEMTKGAVYAGSLGAAMGGIFSGGGAVTQASYDGYVSAKQKKINEQREKDLNDTKAEEAKRITEASTKIKEAFASGEASLDDIKEMRGKIGDKHPLSAVLDEIITENTTPVQDAIIAGMEVAENKAPAKKPSEGPIPIIGEQPKTEKPRLFDRARSAKRKPGFMRTAEDIQAIRESERSIAERETGLIIPEVESQPRTEPRPERRSLFEKKRIPGIPTTPALPKPQGFTMTDQQEVMTRKKEQEPHSIGKMEGEVQVEYKPVITRSGKPFKTQKTAERSLQQQKLDTNTYEVVAYKDGFAIQEKARVVASEIEKTAPESLQQKESMNVQGEGEKAQGGEAVQGEGVVRGKKSHSPIEPTALQAFPEMDEVEGGGYSTSRFAPHEVDSMRAAGLVYRNEAGHEVVDANELWEQRKKFQALSKEEQNALMGESKKKMFEPKPQERKKQPHEMTKEEFNEEAAYQGINAATDESNPSYWFTDQSEEARIFAEGERGEGAPKKTEPRIDIAYKSELGAEWKDSDRPSKSKHAYTGGPEKKRPIRASIPLSAAQNPHKYLVAQAIAEGKIDSHPDYPELSKPTPSETQAAQPKPHGYVWIKEKQRPFKAYREIKRGKNKGKIVVTVAGKGHLVDKSKVVSWPDLDKQISDVTIEIDEQKKVADRALKKGSPALSETQRKERVDETVRSDEKAGVSDADERVGKPAVKRSLFEKKAVGAETAPSTAKHEPVSQKPKPVTESRQKKTPDLTATFPSSYSKTPREVLGKNSLWKVVSKDGKVVETEYATHPHIFIVMDKKDRDAIGYQGKTPQGRDAVVSKEVVDSQLKSFKKRGAEAKTLEIIKHDEDVWGVLSDGNIEVAVNPNFIGMVKRQHPNATFYLNGPERPITAFDGKEWKALIMPLSGADFESARKDAETIIEVPASAKVGKASSPPRPQGATVPKKQNVITGTIREKVDEAIKKAPEIDSDDLLRLDEIRDFKPSKWESADAEKKRVAEDREFYDSLKKKYGTIEITSPTGQGWKYNIINTKHHLGNFKKQIEKLEKGKEGIALFRKKAKAEKAVTEISVDSETLTKGILSRMNRTLKSMGYDVRGADDIKMLLDRRMLRNGKLWHEDWIRAYQQAIEGAELAKARKAQKSERKHINRSRLRELGYTNDPREAGYITPIGKLIDLSGKREGGQPGTRSYDHREAGGTLGMQEFMDEGNIRMDYRAGSFDIAAMPTSAQLSIVRKIAAEKNGEIILDLWEGLGEQRESYYLEPSRVLSVQYREGTKPSKIINDIKTFYAGEMPSKTLFRKSDPTNTGIPIPTIKTALEPITAKWKGAPKIIVTSTNDTKIPKGLMRQMGDAEGVAGAFYEDTVYLFHDNIDSIEDAQKTILHESAHWGPRRMFGRSFDRFLRGVLRSADKGVLDKVAKLYDCDMTKVSDRMLAAEEYVAHISETGQDAKTWARFTSYVKQWMIKRGFTVTLSDDEIRAIVKRGVANRSKSDYNQSVAFKKGPGDKTTEATPQPDGGIDGETEYKNALEKKQYFKAFQILNKHRGIELVSSDIDRGGGHSPADPFSGAPAYDLTGNEIYPEDVYSFNGLRYYGTGEDRMDYQAYDLLCRLRGKPSALLKVYRATEKNTKGGILPGEWVTPIRQYAVGHGKATLHGDYRIQSKLVRAKDIYTSGDSWLEWGYHPQPYWPTIRKKDNDGNIRSLSEVIENPNPSRSPEGGEQVRFRRVTPQDLSWADKFIKDNLDVVVDEHVEQLSRKRRIPKSRAAKLIQEISRAIAIRPTKTLQNQAPDASKDPIEKYRQTIQDDRSLASNWMSQHEDAAKELTRSDKRWMEENFKSFYEKKKPMPNERIQKFTDTWTAIHNNVGDMAKDLGVKEKYRTTEYVVKDGGRSIRVLDTKNEAEQFIKKHKKADSLSILPRDAMRIRPFTKIGRYFPHVFTPEAREALRTRRGEIYDALLNEAKTKGFDLTPYLEDVDIKNLVRRNANLEHARQANMPEYIDTPSGRVQVLEINPFKVIPNSIEASARRLAFVKNWDASTGQALKMHEEYRNAIAQEAGSETAYIWDYLWQDMQGRSRDEFLEDMGTNLQKIFNAGEAIARSFMLSTAQISNIVAGPVPIMVKFGTRRVVGNYIKLATKNLVSHFGVQMPQTEALLEDLRRRGAWAHDTQKVTGDTESLSHSLGGIADTFLKKTGMEAANRFLNKVASFSAHGALFDAVECLKKPDDSAFKRLWGVDHKGLRSFLKREGKWTNEDIDRMIRDGITDNDVTRFVQRSTTSTNVFMERAETRPQFMKNGFWRRVFAYTSFYRTMGAVVSDTFRYAKEGNYRPLITLIVGAAVLGSAEDRVKDFLKGTISRDEESFAWDLLDAFAGSGALAMPGTFINDIKWWTRKGDTPFTIPQVQWWGNVVHGMYNAIKKGIEDAPDEGAKQVYYTTIRNIPLFRVIDNMLGGPYTQYLDDRYRNKGRKGRSKGRKPRKTRD